MVCSGSYFMIYRTKRSAICYNGIEEITLYGGFVMQKKCCSILIAFIMLLAMMPSMMTAHADTGVDVTAPVINSLSVNNAETVNASENLSINMDITEDGTGIYHIDFWFKNPEGHSIVLGWYADGVNGSNNNLLFTGIHTIAVPGENKFATGAYTLTDIAITDRSENVRFYGTEDFADANIDGNITVTQSSNTDISAPIINGLTIQQANNIDASGNLAMMIDLLEDGVGVYHIDFWYKNSEDHAVTLSWYADGVNGNSNNLLFTGKQTIYIPIENKMVKGSYQLTDIAISDKNENTRFYSIDAFAYSNINGNITVTKSSNADGTAPVITSAKILNTNLLTPDLLSIAFGIKEDGIGTSRVELWFKNEDGHTRAIQWMNTNESGDPIKLLKTGTHTIDFPISPFFGEGKYTLTDIAVIDKNQNVRFYNVDGNNGDLTAFNTPVTIRSNFDIAYFGSTANPSGVLNAIKTMGMGETAVLDCRTQPAVQKAIFAAIAGQNKTVVFENDDIQWVFHGSKIKASKCKDITLSSNISIVSGSNKGFPDDKQIIQIEFAENGILPGKADVRINHDYIAAKYGGKSKSLVLSYMDNTTPKTEDQNVQVAKDHAAEFSIDHNSTFVLSDSKARLVKPKLTVQTGSLTTLKLKWETIPGVKNYVLYRASSKKGTYKKVSTIKETAKSYTDKKLKAGKKYYYKLKAVGGDKTIKSVTSKVASGKPALKPPVAKAVKAKNLKKVTLKWGKVKGTEKYVIYRASKEKGTYKKISTTTKTKYIDKKVKKGKTYYYKIIAKHKKSSCSSAKSEAINVTLKK